MGDNKENVPTTSNIVDEVTKCRNIVKPRISPGISPRTVNIPPTVRDLEDPLRDALTYQMETLGSQKPTKAKPVYINIPVTLDPNYDESKDETYLDQIFSSLVMLGEGGFGQVFKGTHNFNNRKYAIKKIKAREDAAKYTEIKHFEKVGYHPHIVKYMMAWEEEHVHILMQLSQMSLANYINHTRNVSELVYFDCIHDICVALEYLAEKGIIHMDIKADNILIHGKLFKLADLGNMLDTIEEPRSTRSAKSRRSLSMNHYDIFSLGGSLLMSIELATSSAPKTCESLQKLLQKMKSSHPLIRPSPEQVLSLNVMQDAVRRYNDGSRPFYTRVNLEDIEHDTLEPRSSRKSSSRREQRKCSTS